MEAFQRAIALDGSNPRPYLLMGQMQLGVAKFFGSSTDEACKLLQRPSQLFEQEQKDGLQPRWGKEIAAESSRMCSAAEAKKE